MLGQLPPDSIQNRGLETMLYGKIRKHPDMSISIKEYERAPPTSCLKSYEWLATEVRRTCSLDLMHRNYQDRDDRMKEMLQDKSKPNKAAAAQEAAQTSKTNNSQKKKKDNAPEQAAAVVTPSKGAKGDRSKDGKGAKKNDRSHSQGKGDHQGKGPAQKADGQTQSRDPSTSHCYWFHHPKGCQRTR